MSCQPQIDELRATLRKPALAARIRPHSAGHMVNELKDMAILVDPLPRLARSLDPKDDFLLAASEAGNANYLVTGDKSHLLALRRHKGTAILSAAHFARQFL